MTSSMRNAFIAVALIIVILIGTKGCGGYGEVNQLTFQHAKALYADCNSRQPERLEACARMISEAETDDKISAKEAGYLQEIIAAGRSENWEEAQAMARELMNDQADF